MFYFQNNPLQFGLIVWFSMHANVRTIELNRFNSTTESVCLILGSTNDCSIYILCFQVSLPSPPSIPFVGRMIDKIADLRGSCKFDMPMSFIRLERKSNDASPEDRSSAKHFLDNSHSRQQMALHGPGVQ